MPYFDQVKRFCLFASTGRSGHSILAHLLSAHPKVMICDELSAVSYFMEGYSRQQVFALIKNQDYRYQRRNRKKSGYDYSINGLWQNVYDKHPEVIGDAKGSRTVTLAGRQDGSFDLFRQRLGLPLRVLIHLRNPFDIITTQSRKREKSLEESVDNFIDRERLLGLTYDIFSDEERLVQRHEDVISEPGPHFKRMFEFLGVEPIEEVVEECAAKVWTRPHQTRKGLDWPKKEIKRLEACLKKSRLFSSYSYKG